MLSRRFLIVVLVLLLAAIFSAWDMELNWADIRDLENTWQFLSGMWPLDFSMVGHALDETLLTLEVAFLGTLFGLLIAFPLSFLAAENTAPHRSVSVSVRFILTGLRSIPELVLALIFVPTFGLEPLTVVVAIALHNSAVLGKLIAELVEAAEPGPREAVASTGAPPLLVALYGVVPQIAPNILSQSFYRLEVGVRSSLLFGAIGAGGIGDVLFLHFKTFEYAAMAVDILLIMGLIWGLDIIGGWLRRKVI
ncbi:phosphonate ABC transporter, permease protein PhnE [Marinithermofilum abyssi]|uniref:Phosphonate ABC transporter, permease protein PhnE n=1 Tax=Marinithermofilum abyssi TaxID=1571185 RepID=A0A8J2VDY2_9BACL|nr:phosphonate ABC transporter, permease protein PhnE [Marinithermofilum abyssi]GGE20127.1 phosphonate ABC transporter, permease protein PhnE [Marinithermofilum abyssi]